MEPPKRDHQLADVHAAGDDLLLSARAAELLRGVAGAELLPITVRDHARQPCPERYYLLRPITIDCLELARCHPQWNLIDDESISELAAIVIDSTRVGDVQVFRCSGYTEPVIVARQVADQLAALGLTGLHISYLKR